MMLLKPLGVMGLLCWNQRGVWIFLLLLSILLLGVTGVLNFAMNSRCELRGHPD